MRTVGIVGAGGFGREIYPLALQQLASDMQAGTARLSFVVEDGYAHRYSQRPRRADMDRILPAIRDLYFTVAIADGAARKRITLRALAEGMRPYEIKCRTSIILEGIHHRTGRNPCSVHPHNGKFRDRCVLSCQLLFLRNARLHHRRLRDVRPESTMQRQCSHRRRRIYRVGRADQTGFGRQAFDHWRGRGSWDGRRCNARCSAVYHRHWQPRPPHETGEIMNRGAAAHFENSCTELNTK